MFEMQPGHMNPAEAERAIGEQVGIGEIISGSAVHRGSVLVPGGPVEFFLYRVIDVEAGSQPVICTSTMATSSTGAAWACGGDLPEEARQPVQVSGESWGGSWRTADLLVQDDVDRVEATAVDGTVYTVVPLSGFGYIEWPDERGSLELVAYDAQGQELGQAFAGLEQ